MATAKKKAVKKTVAATKKPVKKATKRTYNRKKTAEEVSNTAADQAAEQVIPNGVQEGVDPLPGTAEQEYNQRRAFYKQLEDERNLQQERSVEALRDLEFINLMDHDPDSMTRIVLALELAFLGYKFMLAHSHKLVNPATPAGISLMSFTEVLELNHDNKLLISHTMDSVGDRYSKNECVGYIIGTKMDIQLGYSEPTDGKPELIQKDNATYVRIS